MIWIADSHGSPSSARMSKATGGHENTVLLDEDNVVMAIPSIHPNEHDANGWRTCTSSSDRSRETSGKTSNERERATKMLSWAKTTCRHALCLKFFQLVSCTRIQVNIPV